MNGLALMRSRGFDTVLGSVCAIISIAAAATAAIGLVGLVGDTDWRFLATFGFVFGSLLSLAFGIAAWSLLSRLRSRR